MLHHALCRLGTVPGTKLTSSYRGVSVNSSTGMWTAVVWNPQTRAAQHIGDYHHPSWRCHLGHIHHTGLQ